MKVIHYTKEKDFQLKPIIIKNGDLPIKPRGGLWASPLDSKDSWKDWCEAESFSNIESQRPIVLTLDISKFITIDKNEDLDKLPWFSMSGFLEAVDFEKLVEMGVEGIYLTTRGQWATRLTYPRHLYGWDCESVLILNERCIKEWRRVY